MGRKVRQLARKGTGFFASSRMKSKTNRPRTSRSTIQSPNHPITQSPNLQMLQYPTMRITILGSGTSHGVPMIGCKCAVCLSDDPRNKRFRPSVAVENDGKTILVDTTPELRVQALAVGLEK